MAVIATMSAFPIATLSQRQVAVRLTLMNNGASAVSVVNVRPTAVMSGATQTTSSAALSRPALGPGVTTSVAGGGGVLSFDWFQVFHAPQSGWGLANPTSSTYVLGAEVLLSDGTYVLAQTTQVQVVPTPTGQPDYTPTNAPSHPTQSSAPTFPSTGQARMDYLLNSDLVPVLFRGCP
jgi:hypothetical protein